MMIVIGNILVSSEWLSILKKLVVIEAIMSLNGSRKVQGSRGTRRDMVNLQYEPSKFVKRMNILIYLPLEWLITLK